MENGSVTVAPLCGSKFRYGDIFYGYSAYWRLVKLSGGARTSRQKTCRHRFPGLWWRKPFRPGRIQTEETARRRYSEVHDDEKI